MDLERGQLGTPATDDIQATWLGCVGHKEATRSWPRWGSLGDFVAII